MLRAGAKDGKKKNQRNQVQKIIREKFVLSEVEVFVKLVDEEEIEESYVREKWSDACLKVDREYWSSKGEKYSNIPLFQH